MPLTDAACRNAKPKEKPYKLADEKALYLRVTEAGKYFRMDYRFANRRKTLALGVYPDVSLQKAREGRDEARKKLAQGLDPGHEKKVEKATKAENAENSFEVVAREWFDKYSPTWAESHSERIISRLERDVFPWVGARPIREISPPELLVVLRRIEARTLDTAHRALQNCRKVFQYAVATGRLERDPTYDLNGALPPVEGNNFASIIDPAEIGGLLRAIEGYQGSFITRCALQLAPYLWVRPGEFRAAEWAEFDLVKGEWRIPAPKRKLRKKHKQNPGAMHLVPLAKQVVAILDSLHKVTGAGRYLFPGVQYRDRPMSENTVNSALRRLGYTSEQMTGHGFRSMASTLLNEQGTWSPDAIEVQLAHKEKNRSRGAYNYAKYLPERMRMMQWWADYLDSLKKALPTMPDKLDVAA